MLASRRQQVDAVDAAVGELMNQQRVVRRAVVASALAVGLVVSGLPSCGGNGVVSAIQVSSQSEHTCAVISDGHVRCWGRNDDGQLGDGTRTWRSRAVLVAPLDAAIKVAAGVAHTCALRSDGSVACWGKGNDGQVDGTSASRLTPTRLPFGGATDVAVGYAHSCAVAAGKVKCWGSNAAGNLGTGGRDPQSGIVEVEGVSDAQAVAAGYGTCAILGDGRVECWGGYFPDVPTVVNGITGATAISLNDYGVCAVAGGKLACAVAGGVTVVIADATRNFVGVSGFCAVLDDGAVACFEHPPSAGSKPIEIAGLEARSVASGGSHTCAALVTGDVRCWGDRLRGKLGDGWVPTYLSASGVAGASALAVSPVHTCVVIGGEARCWGGNSEGQLGNGAITAFRVETPIAPVVGLGKATAIAVGDDHTCAIVEGGEVKCWGANDHGGYLVGMLGDGTTNRSPLPVSTGLQGATSLALGGASSCAVSGGQVLCWGFRLFDPGSKFSLVPLAVPALAGAMEVSVGYGAVCGRYADGHVACAGAPAPVGAFKSIAIASDYGCGILELNIPQCWGGSIAAGGSGAASFAFAGLAPNNTLGTYGCALAGGAVRCWGDDTWNELGDGDAGVKFGVQVDGVAGATLLAGQKGRNCALLASGDVRCWGLGDPNETVPAPGRVVLGLK